jgi:predicted negative regulator of RcsB-dependent stress response
MSKKDKAADPFQKELQKGFQWTTEHTRLVTLAALIFLVAFGGWALKNYFDKENELEAQTAYFPLEKALLEKRAQFMAAEEPPPAKDAKNKAPTPQGPKPTGDFTKDYGSEASALETFIDKYPHSKAAQMAALNLASIQNEYKQYENAEKTLGKVKNDSATLTSGLVLSELGNAQANRSNCQNAIETWNQVLNNKKAAFLQNSVKLKQALCYEALKNPDKAKSLYVEIQTADKQGALGKTAEKYFRLLEAKAESAETQGPR